MIIDFMKMLTQMVCLSRLVVLAWAKQVVNLLRKRMNFMGWAFFPGSDDHEPVQ